jgi:endonuclease YncB( thermonuclease family)
MTAQPQPHTASPSSTASVDAVTSDGAVISLDDGSVYSVDSSDQSAVSQWSSGDQAAVDDTGDAITNLSSGDNVPVTEAGQTDDFGNTSYADTGAEHSQDTSSDDGSIVVLDDGSIWSVASADQATTAAWTDGDSIVVNDSSSGIGSYQLVNTDTQEAVDASYVGDE